MMMKIPYAIIGYIPGKGYGFIEHSPELDESSLAKIWRQAIPRGTGWSTFIGARILKGFHIGQASVVVSSIRVTKEQDEFGRSGLLKASVQIMSPSEYVQHLRKELADLPQIARDEAERKFPTLSQLMLKTTRHLRTMIVHPYQGVTDWQTIEALTLRLVLSLPKPLIPKLSFTTLALSATDEARIVALPLRQAEDIHHRAIYID